MLPTGMPQRASAAMSPRGMAPAEPASKWFVGVPFITLRGKPSTSAEEG
jgi:hypothetical protein